MENRLGGINADINGLSAVTFYCPFCGTENNAKNKFCFGCGKDIGTTISASKAMNRIKFEDVDKVDCPNCTFVNQSSDNFCAKCGTKLTANVISAPPGRKTCTKCFFANTSQDAFCAQCGSRL